VVRKVAYWASTSIAALMLSMALTYAYSSGEGPRVWAMPPALLVLLAVSYLTRPRSRSLAAGGPRGPAETGARSRARP
jgi:hypothetical protein